ncbi:MAG: phosphoenolpyruvate synthase [Paludibacteraceae bacterium]|nr:phosphoenolpyruvate synthase [Paludibacteraceae bacterium]
MNTNTYTSLMERRVRRILLVCNNYDSFALEEDGRIDVQIAQEYAELNLSNPPAITRAETTDEALKLITPLQLSPQGERVSHGERSTKEEPFDLIITVYSAGGLDVFDFAAESKRLLPDCPIVLLSLFSKEVYRRVEQQDKTNIDYLFNWNNSTDLIIAIIKLIEDRMNAEHDILSEGVRAILLVEDSVRYYSTYLPLLYKLVLQQNTIAIRDALNEKQQLLRKRARPKVLMATCYDEAIELYNRYKENIIGVISDVGFVLHKGEPSSAEKLDAGVDLCRLIREDNPTMPFLMQSSQESIKSVARKLNVGFVVKKSKTLTQELSAYIEREFGFGDFVAVDPRTGKEIGRASDLEGFERIISSISSAAFRRLSDNNYLSKWLFARGLFAIGHEVHKLTIQDDADIENIRQTNIRLIHDYRINQALGVVAKYAQDTYNDTIWFARCGDGAMGGKGRGLAFLNHMLQKHDLYDRWQDVRVLVPRTMVLTTDWFDRFINKNGLQYVINADLTDEELLSEFVSASLPSELVHALRHFIRVTQRPLAIRSSSKLEDNYYQPFAGVYSTYMIPHTENEDQQLRLLTKAIKSVYASVYFAASRGYIISTGNVPSEEQMAIVLQEVSGETEGNYYFPVISGVARSINFYPVGKEKPEDGIVKIAYGLGKAVVDGEQVLRFSPKYPKNVMQTSTVDLAMRETQQSMLALSLSPEKFKTSIDDAVNLERILIHDCGQFESLKLIASTYDRENMRIVDSCYPDGPRIVTFAPQLKFNTFPLAEIIRTLLDIAQQEIKCPVEIEFAVNLEHEPQIFHVLQIRPISSDSLSAKVEWESIDETGAFLRSGSALGVGKIEEVTDIIYLKKEAFDVLRTREMAATLREWNNRLRTEGRQYLLIGYGRWGSQIPTLGVPVQWSDISEAKAIAECSLENFRIEPSQGSHFFQNMTSFNVGYMNVDPWARPLTDAYDQSVLDALPAVEETELVRHVRVKKPLEMYIDGFENKAVIKK